MDNDSLYQIHAYFVINNKINKTNVRCVQLFTKKNKTNARK
jgi:hypothetical protein